ncbi:MAG: hypothetical protein KGZ81_02080 [Flavobacteriales bacterium]|jgi:hypothetical protein|nr:hypothetical protein [Flavobacteriales bacterium]
MSWELQHLSELEKQVQQENLLEALIVQTNKDFQFANHPLDLSLQATPEQIIQVVHQKVYDLLQYQFTEYLNLLYIVDVPEAQVKSITANDMVEISEQVTFLLIKRIWQKVYLRKHYSN